VAVGVFGIRLNAVLERPVCELGCALRRVAAEKHPGITIVSDVRSGVASRIVTNCNVDMALL
jgi:hypothetical protein